MAKLSFGLTSACSQWDALVAANKKKRFRNGVHCILKQLARYGSSAGELCAGEADAKTKGWLFLFFSDEVGKPKNIIFGQSLTP